MCNLEGIRAALGLFVVAALVFAPSAFAVKVITVDSMVDEFDDDVGDNICHTATGHCTLRAAVMQAANSDAAVTDGVRIVVPAGVYTFTIPVASGGGQLQLSAPLIGNPYIEIDGAGAGVTIIDANHIDRAFLIDRAALLSGMTIRNAYVDAALSGGGAIWNRYAVTLNAVVLSDNATSGPGGAISNNGVLEINGSSILRNTAGNGGGGIYGAFYSDDVQGSINIYASTIALNTSSYGGGIFNIAPMLIANSTIAANDSTIDGGGIYNVAASDSAVNVYNTTIAFNDADHARETGGAGGGILVNSINGGVFNLYNSVVAQNTVSNTPLADDCFGAVSTHARNRFGSTANCSITQVSGSYTLLSPNVLGDLQDNGGPTLTIALPLGSNAINAGDPVNGCRDITSTAFLADQRGFPRNVGICDLGSYEYGALDPKDRVFTDGFEILPPPVH
jgi:hypothetical protein